MTSREFVKQAINIATNYNTLYVMGCFGAPMTPANKARYTSNHAYNKNPERTEMINAVSDDTFGFDCVCLIKGILWGWKGDKTKTYGGAVYISNNVPDIDANQMLNMCTTVSTDFSGIVPGAVVGMPDHIGIYVGDGHVVECTPKWENCVQITSLGNLGIDTGVSNSRIWSKWGLLPYISYDEDEAMTTELEQKIRKIVREEIAATLAAMDKSEPTEDWQKEWLEKAMSYGISDGTRPMGFCTRLESMIMATKAYLKGLRETYIKSWD